VLENVVLLGVVYSDVDVGAGDLEGLYFLRIIYVTAGHCMHRHMANISNHLGLGDEIETFDKVAASSSSQRPAIVVRRAAMPSRQSAVLRHSSMACIFIYSNMGEDCVHRNRMPRLARYRAA